MQKITDILTSKQTIVYEDIKEKTPVFTILHGAVRSGKTFLGIILWLMFVASFRDKGYNFIMTGFTLSSLKKNVLDDIESFFGIYTKLDSNNSFQMFGNTILCFGTNASDSYKAMRGLTAYGWYANEITLSHKNSVEEALKRCSGKGARHIWETNPDNPNHFVKTDFIDRSGEMLSDGKHHIIAHHFSIDDNTKLDLAYVESIKKTTPKGVSYDWTIRGLWVAREGIVYDCFIESQMVCENPYYCSEYFAGVDWGFEHFGVIVLLGVFQEKVIIVDIIKERKKDIDWWKAQQDEIKSRYKCLDWYCDSARPEYVSKFKGIEADKAVIEGIDKVYSMLYNGTLLVSEKAKKLFVEEVYQYRWKETGVKEEPIKENDDIMDALRYAIFTKYGKKQEENFYKKMYGRKK